MGKLDGKIALITGASEGIGFATAQLFLDEGIEHVFITGHRKEVLDEAAKQLNSDRVTSIQADSSILTDLDKVYQVIKEEKDRLDILFANAGAAEFSPLDLVNEEHFHYLFDVNVKGVIFTVQKALPIFSDGGSIILNGFCSMLDIGPERSWNSSERHQSRSYRYTYATERDSNGSSYW